LRGGRDLITRIEIGMPSTRGAATKSGRRDLDKQVSSLFLGATSRMTISTRGAFSTGRVSVGRGL
jgi:hypothetical protein